MKFVILLIVTSTVCVFSSRSHQYHENVYDTEIVSEKKSEDLRHQIFKKSISTHPSYENSVNPEGAVQEPCRLSLPTMELSPVPQDPYSDENQNLPMEVMPPRVPNIPYNIPLDNWTPYDLEYLSQEPGYDEPYNGVSYNSYNMPYTNPNAVPTVRFLPPVSTRILESIPEIPESEADIANYLSDDEYFPPYVRAVRSRDEDFLVQLEKDAMIPNILPTMPYPYMRTASLPPYQGQHGVSGPIAMILPNSGSGCGVPFLLRCSPNIYQGTLKNKINDGKHIHSAQD